MPRHKINDVRTSLINLVRRLNSNLKRDVTADTHTHIIPMPLSYRYEWHSTHISQASIQQKSDIGYLRGSIKLRQ